MLIKELLPHVEQKHAVTFSTCAAAAAHRPPCPPYPPTLHRPSQLIRGRCRRDPSDRLLMGHSSGGVASMAGGFHNSQAFGNVISHCASYVNIRGPPPSS